MSEQDRREPVSGPDGTPLPPPPPYLPPPPVKAKRDNSRGCLLALATGFLGLWAIAALVSAFQDKRELIPPDGGMFAGISGPVTYSVPRVVSDEVGLVGFVLPCLLAVILAVLSNLGRRRSVGTCLLALGIGAMTMVGGAVQLGQPVTVRCKANVSVSDIFESYDVVACPAQVEHDYRVAVESQLRHDARLVLLSGFGTVVVAVGLLIANSVRDRRPTPLRPPDTPSS